MNFSGSGHPRKLDNVRTDSIDSGKVSSSRASSFLQQSSDEKRFNVPSLSLPKGGGAIQGIGEKFSASPVTGTATLSVPIVTSPGRSGFGPSLSLSYDSGSGNGPFGFGWTLSTSSITRKTSKGLPKYEDANESDIFILSGAEDLVPVFRKDQGGNWLKNPDGTYVIDEQVRSDYLVKQYKPRTEGLFARIERWTNRITGDTHWRSISKDNILTVYGRNINSRIADPEDDRRVFSWLICESYDDKGNAIIYEYIKENGEGIDNELLNVNERNRIRTANRYMKRIFYGNRRPLLLDASRTSFRKSHLELSEDDFSHADFMFEVVFDYDEGHYVEIPLDNSKTEDEQHRFVEASESEGKSWSGRPDPFSSYRSTFEIRTYRRCQRVMMFHRFPELGTEPYLVRSTDFSYADIDYSNPNHVIRVSEELKHPGSTRFASFIQNVVQSGYLQDKTKPIHEINGIKYSTYFKKTMPPLEFEYTKAEIQQNFMDLDDTVIENLPIGIDGGSYQFVDLDGEGVAGVLTEQGDSWFYKSNLGDGKFDPIETVKIKPSMGDLKSGRQVLLDLAGDGQLDAAQMSSPVSGFYERTQDKNWENFTPFESFPNISLNDPSLRFIDLTGDGHADILITEDEAFSWYPSLAEKGFGSSNRVCKELDEEKGPRLIFSESSEAIYLADMSGDGLIDLVKIRNGNVCYWPNLGYGRFGAKITMDNSPWFDTPEHFDPKCIRLADIDGSGVTDIIYLGGNNGIKLYFNQSGNRWSNVYHISGLQMDNYSSVQVVDLFGKGTACLVWSSPLSGNSKQPMRYLDLMGGIKSHLLFKSSNNLGAETRIQYASSTKFYLNDKRNRNPWITRLPFPVHVVERVETYDYINRNYFVSLYAYHHGYYDGIEREFRGFGMVEQWDTEEFATLTNSDAFPWADNIKNESHVPPVCTKSWFHTGCYLDKEHISDYFGGFHDSNDRGEYYREPAWEHNDLEAKKYLLDDTVLPLGLTVDEEFEACRALTGHMLRQEVYLKDGAAKSEIPYTATEQNYSIRPVQPRGQNKHAIFFTYPKELINYNYERTANDPRTSHDISIEVDQFGNVLKHVEINYGRRNEDPKLRLIDDRQRQTNKHIVYTENSVTNRINMEDGYRTPLQCESVRYELTGYELSNDLERFKDSDFFNSDPNNPEKSILIFDNTIQYEEKPTSGRQRRPIEHERTIFRKNDLSSALPLGNIELLALPWDAYTLAFTPGLLDRTFKRSDPQNSNIIVNLLPNISEVLGSNGAATGGYNSSQYLKSVGIFPNEDADGYWWSPSGRIFFSPDYILQEINYAIQHFFLPQRYQDALENTTAVTYDSNDLLIVKIQDPVNNFISFGERDAVGNIIKLAFDYRLLQPRLLMDANQNCSIVAFDVLGMVVGTALTGRPNSTIQEGDNLIHFDSNLTSAAIQNQVSNPLNNTDSILCNATSRMVYDLFAYQRTKEMPIPEPPVVYMLVRESHYEPSRQTSNIQHIFSYHDGFGRVIQKKIRVESGPDPLDPSSLLDPRWVGTGWTILNNKGKPICQYQPFFTNTHLFEFKRIDGVSSIAFYDALGRNIILLHANDTYEKFVFDNWKETTYDVDDTVLLDPRTDSDTSNVVAKYFESKPSTWQTWYDQRITGANGVEETAAATKTEVHADTPTISYLDSLGRKFMTLQHNGYEAQGDPILFPRRLDMDIVGNIRIAKDSKIENGDSTGRIVVKYDYNMLGSIIYQLSMEAGERWTLNDVTGKPIRQWDSRGHTMRTEYDSVGRKVRCYVIGADPENQNNELLVERFVYGEQHPQHESLNLRGNLYLQIDQAGVRSNECYDFKGNVVRVSDRLVKQYERMTDWRSVDENHIALPIDPDDKFDQILLETSLNDVLKNDEKFTNINTYDALNRLTQIVFPFSSKNGTKFNVTQPRYNEGNMLQGLDGWIEIDELPSALLSSSTATQHFIKDIKYDAKGRRVQIEYGNGATTAYHYDQTTFRIMNLQILRNGTEIIQDLFYCYDPVGNIVSIRDESQQTIFFNGQVVKAHCEYTYDSIYRLVQAIGREHIGQASHPQSSWNDEFRIGLPHPHDGQKMRRYRETYDYDEAGNIIRLEHGVTHNNSNNWTGNWSRVYNYNEESLIETGKNNNRLTNTIVHPNSNQSIVETYTYDQHGNMTSMPHIGAVFSDYGNEVKRIELGGGGTVYYIYDSSGRRVRKIHKHLGALVEERIYLNNYEIYRKFNGNGLKLERETLHITDNEQTVAMIDTRTIDNSGGHDPSPHRVIRYQFINHLRSVMLELDELSKVISFEEYTPYGSTSYQAAQNIIELPSRRYRYSHKERDEETGLYNYGLRLYAPWLARWTSCDPIGPVDEFNLFCFNRNNPINFLDDVGMDPRYAGPDPPRRRVGNPLRGSKPNKSNFVANAWKYSSGSDKIAVGSQAIPYLGDYVGLMVSAAEFGVDPSLTSLKDLGGDLVGAALPFVPALGTARRVERATEKGLEAEKIAAKAASELRAAKRAEESAAEAAKVEKAAAEAAKVEKAAAEAAKVEKAAAQKAGVTSGSKKVSGERPTTGGGKPPTGGGKPPTGGQGGSGSWTRIGLGLDEDLHRLRGATTYVDNGWARIGLTAPYDAGSYRSFNRALTDALNNADEIHFQLSSFTYAYPLQNLTAMELRMVHASDDYLRKTTFFRGSTTYRWNVDEWREAVRNTPE
jgi:RHS repeat-associated protein